MTTWTIAIKNIREREFILFDYIFNGYYDVNVLSTAAGGEQNRRSLLTKCMQLKKTMLKIA